MAPSGRLQPMARDSTGAPPTSRFCSVSTIARMIEGTPASTNTLSIWKPGAIETEFSMGTAPSGMKHILRRASLKSAGSAKRAAIRSKLLASLTSPTPKARAMLAAVMSSWVGPMPPVVKT